MILSIPVFSSLNVSFESTPFFIWNVWLTFAPITSAWQNTVLISSISSSSTATAALLDRFFECRSINSSTVLRIISWSFLYGNHIAPLHTLGSSNTKIFSGLHIRNTSSACTLPFTFTWSWFPTSMIVGCVHFASSRMISFRVSTGNAPRWCQKSPRKRMPLFSFAAIAWTCFKVSSAISLVFRLTCTSENTTHPFVFISSSSKDDDDVIVVAISLLLLFSWFANRERSKRRDDGKGWWNSLPRAQTWALLVVVWRVPLERPLSGKKSVIALFLMYETWYEYYSLLILLLFSESFAKAQRKKCSTRMCLRRIREWRYFGGKIFLIFFHA